VTTFSVPTLQEIEQDWTEFTGGPPVIGALGSYMPGDVEALAIDAAERGAAMMTWAIRDGVAELVSIHSSPPGRGLGRQLLLEFEERVRAAGARRIVVITTNDNVPALRFYLREGYRLVRVHLDAMDRVRDVKPHVPAAGQGGMPLQDQWELEKVFAEFTPEVDQ
jgi:GNAT superfamily N-acetyltransferase